MCIRDSSNVGSDHQQLTMMIMQNVARRYGLVCLLHEKPFAGVNGSGKHNNWSMGTDTGLNLLEPGDTPSENLSFLFFCSAVIQAVNQHQELLRASIALSLIHICRDPFARLCKPFVHLITRISGWVAKRVWVKT